MVGPLQLFRVFDILDSTTWKKDNFFFHKNFSKPKQICSKILYFCFSQLVYILISKVANGKMG